MYNILYVYTYYILTAKRPYVLAEVFVKICYTHHNIIEKHYTRIYILSYYVHMYTFRTRMFKSGTGTLAGGRVGIIADVEHNFEKLGESNFNDMP